MSIKTVTSISVETVALRAGLSRRFGVEDSLGLPFMLCSASQSIADNGVSACTPKGRIKQKSQNLPFIQNHRHRC
jgi:hypothetical protein